MKKFIAVCLLFVVGCKSQSVGKNQNIIYKEAEATRQAMVHVKTQADTVAVKLAEIEQSSQLAYESLSSVLLETPTDVALPHGERLKTALKANADILEDVDGAEVATKEIIQSTKVVTTSANQVTKAASNVQDVVGFWESLGDGIRKVVTLLTLVLVVIIGWRFGLDSLIKSILGWVSKGFTWTSDWFYSKYDGPVKLISEGKVHEGIAALRSAVPGLNKSFQKKKNKSNAEGGGNDG
jgi:hypothetical protein